MQFNSFEWVNRIFYNVSSWNIKDLDYFDKLQSENVHYIKKNNYIELYKHMRHNGQINSSKLIASNWNLNF